MSILVTGSNGFIGSALCNRLQAEGRDLRRAVRNPSTAVNTVAVGDLRNAKGSGVYCLLFTNSGFLSVFFCVYLRSTMLRAEGLNLCPQF